MRFDKVLWLDTETLSLDPKVASIRELSFVAEVGGHQVGEIQSYKVQPILHLEDQIYGHYCIDDFCNEYNKKFHAKDPDRLVTFGFEETTPLFFHSYSALTFNIPAPHVLNPSDWLIGRDILPAYEVLSLLRTYLKENSSTDTKWVLAGHNIKYDLDVLLNWATRILGKNESKMFSDIIHNFVYLDTLSLSRWMQYSGRLQSTQANLGIVAQELGISTSNSHTASADVFMCKEVAKYLLESESL